MGLPSNSVKMSPALRPALAAGEPGPHVGEPYSIGEFGEIGDAAEIGAVAAAGHLAGMRIGHFAGRLRLGHADELRARRAYRSGDR